jgi:ADP-ribosyl-[dinitrogen reductase] hydrolase
MMLDARTFDKMAGVAVGAAVGDAFGMPLEFTPPRPAGHLVTEMTGGRLPAGSFTDDTEMALALAESLLAQRPLNPADLAARFTDWFRASPPDMGVHTAHVLRQVASGVSWESASRAAWQANLANAGNGSIMRCWPVALAFWRDPAQLATASALQSQVTHYHPECVAASVFVNELIVRLLHGDDPVQAVDGASAAGLLPDGLSQVVRTAPDRQRDELKNSGWVRHTLESAVWGLLTTTTFEDAVVQVANLGNDADTAAAVVGSLAGATYGLASIPARWRAQLNGVWPLGSGRHWDEQKFIRLVHSLVNE